MTILKYNRQVAIPWAAHYQAKTYSQRYALPVHLISHFPSFFLDDPSQLNASYGVQAVTQHLVSPDAAASSHLSETTVEDWWPEGVDNKDGGISVLIRLGEPVDTGTCRASSYQLKRLTDYVFSLARPRTSNPHGSLCRPPNAQCTKSLAVADLFGLCQRCHRK